MAENTTNLNNLLQNVAIIQKKYEDIAQITGENFNVFSVMNMEHSEVNTHSAIIGELLNPNGLHGQNDIFLNLFIDEINTSFKNEIDLKKFNNLVNEKICERTITQGNDWKNVTGGRIDIIIEDDKQMLIIENKIYAIDQPFQLIRYNNYAKTKKKNYNILYLTLDGKELEYKEIPYLENDGVEIKGFNHKYTNKKEYDKFVEENESNTHHHCLYYPISFEIHIRNWIEKCIEKTHSLPTIRETLVQYLYLVKKLTNQTTSKKMSEEIIETILSSKENIKGALEIAGNINNLKQVICKDFFDQIKDKLKADFDFEDYKGNNNIGRKDSGIYFSKKENKDKKVLLWFGSDYNQLEIGVTDENNSWIEKKEEGFASFNKINWEDLLDSKEIDNAVNEIKQFFEKV